MMPRSHEATGKEWYACRTHAETGGPDACAMPNLNRAAVEVPALRMFEKWALDVDGTRRTVTDQMDGRVALARGEAERAARGGDRPRHPGSRGARLRVGGVGTDRL